LRRQLLVFLALVLSGALLGCGAAKPDASPKPEESPAPKPTVITNPDPEQVVVGKPCGHRITRSDGRVWRCTFADNFDGAVLDTGKWLVLASSWTGLGGPDDCYFDDRRNISVSDGILRLTTRRLAQPRACAQAEGGQASYTGAMINTLHRFSQEQGRFEFRARFPRTKRDRKVHPGIQGSLWMWPINDTKYGSWPSSGEIDIAEFYSAHPDRVIPFLHYDMENNHKVLDKLAVQPRETNNHCLFAAPDGHFHTYTLEWTRKQMHILYDDLTCLKTPWVSKQGGSAPFDQPFMLAIGFGTGQFENSVTKQTPLPAHLDVDYVRVWK
jgi:beta-glucanase (GH16 family)